MKLLACTFVHNLINLLIADRDGTHQKLGYWVGNMRKALKGTGYYRMNNARIRRLNSLDFPWFPREDKVWSKNFSALLNFEKENGHCRVPRR